jgi:hypothetical protein
MRVRLSRFGTAVLGCVAAIVSSAAAVASADPPDPHQPDLTQNYCPGAQWSFDLQGPYNTQVCDGEKYPDGSYWHQWKHYASDSGVYSWYPPEWHHDCVGDSGNNAFPAPPPPGGCAGAIPPA